MSDNTAVTFPVDGVSVTAPATGDRPEWVILLTKKPLSGLTNAGSSEVETPNWLATKVAVAGGLVAVKTTVPPRPAPIEHPPGTVTVNVSPFATAFPPPQPANAPPKVTFWLEREKPAGSVNVTVSPGFNPPVLDAVKLACQYEVWLPKAVFVEAKLGITGWGDWATLKATLVTAVPDAPIATTLLGLTGVGSSEVNTLN